MAKKDVNSEALTPFDFINSASYDKNNILEEADLPDQVIKQFNAFIINKGFSYFTDTILHANEMNRLHNLDKDMQYIYYFSVLRPRKRFSKWHKQQKNDDLDLIQQHYQCNRTIAKSYLKVLTKENLDDIKKKYEKGGN